MSQHRAHRRLRRVIAQIGSGSLLVAGAAVIATTTTAPLAHSAAQSISTTTNITDGSGFCVNPDGTGETEDPTNCNAYAVKTDVWLSNLPHTLGEGDYFFAVNVPGTQSTPNDGAPGLLSSDSRADRTFHVAADGTISTAGPHAISFDDFRIQMAPFDDTTNGGGVYNASVCALPSPDPDAPVSGDDCTHDSFKVVQDDPPPPALPLSVEKSATGAYTTTYGWAIDKTVADDTLEGVSGTVTANYTVTLTHDAGTVSDTGITGTVTITNPNPDPVIADITDTFSDAGVVCTLAGAGDDVEVAPGDTPLAFSCDLAEGVVPGADLSNSVTVEWDVQTVGPALLEAGSDTASTGPIGFTETVVDECATVDDSVAGLLGQVCVGDANPAVANYSHDWPLDQPGCVDYPNTATFVTNDTGTTGDDTQIVTVCKTPLNTGAHTIGFWSNKNGQGVIKGGTSTGTTCNSGSYLRTFAPFQDLSATATCTQVASYVSSVISKASAAGASMNAMLKAQMLATALSVYFTGPGSTLATQKFLPNTNLGGITIDLTNIKGRDVSGAFGPDGADGSATVSQMLAYAGSQSNVGGSIWYGQDKVVQADAKDAFDAINNNAVFAP